VSWGGGNWSGTPDWSSNEALKLLPLQLLESPYIFVKHTAFGQKLLEFAVTVGFKQGLTTFAGVCQPFKA